MSDNNTKDNKKAEVKKPVVRDIPGVYSEPIRRCKNPAVCN